MMDHKIRNTLVRRCLAGLERLSICTGLRTDATLRTWARVVLALSVLAGAMDHAAAAELFAPLSEDQRAVVSPAKTQHIDQIRQRPTTISLNLVRINVAALNDDSAQISLPNANRLDFTRSRIETRSTTDFTWFGSLSGVPGKATLVVRDGNITGSIREDGNLYRVEPIGDGVHAVIKVDQSRFPPEHPPSFRNIEQRDIAVPHSALDSATRTLPVDIDVLVAYTPAARTAVADITALIQLAIAEANQSYQNSQVGIRLNLADSFEVPYSESGKSFDSILADFVSNATVVNRRNSSGADMAALIINQSDYCGLANDILANAANAYAVVYYDCATGYYSFAHELGHLQGARHDPNNDPSTSPFPYGHGYQHPSATAAQRFRTIMAYRCTAPENCEPRIQYWSNPNVSYNGVPTGSVALNDNARVLNGTASSVAAFRSRPAADLVVESLTHSPANPRTGTQISFTAVVKNIGTAAAGASTLSFKVGGETPPGQMFGIPPLAVGQTATVTRKETLFLAQNYRNTATADIGNVVPESNEANNVRTDDYTVTPDCSDGSKRKTFCKVGSKWGTRVDVCVKGTWRLGVCSTRCTFGEERFVPCSFGKLRVGSQRQICNRSGAWVNSGGCLGQQP